ncbi:MAG: hypothetical protein JNK83_12740 [Rhizobiales bacterium]|nr:hypothetical protein [Hyphomicrobiales bacterium]
MSTESKDFDPYAIVLADLRAKREQIDQTIQAIESFRMGGMPSAQQGQVAGAPPSPTMALEPGAFHGLSIAEAAKKLLSIRKRQLSNGEILAEFRTGNFHMSSVDPINTIGAVLTRRFKETGDIVRVGKGTWGLKEWYPGRTFSKVAKGNGGNEASSSASAPPLTPDPDDPLG